MAVYTDISDAELTAFLADYDLGRPLALKGIAEGVENSNFLLETEGGRFILTIYERRVRAEDLPYFLDILRWLAARGFACPTPQADRAGRVLKQIRDKPAALVSFMPGLSLRQPDAAHCRTAGAGLATLHLAGVGFAGRRANDLGRERWRTLFAPARGAADRLRPGLTAEIDADLDALDAAWPSDLPTGLIHADFFPDNVFFDARRFAGAIDFYFACDDAYAYDLAIAVNAWAFTEDGYDPRRAAAMVEGYAATRPLGERERTALGVMARGAAMRFFLTRLIDWEAARPGALVVAKDPLDYERRLAFHRGCGGELPMESVA